MTPLTAARHAAAARRLVAMAARVEATASACTPQQRRARTLAINRLAREAKWLQLVNAGLPLHSPGGAYCRCSPRSGSTPGERRVRAEHAPQQGKQ